MNKKIIKAMYSYAVSKEGVRPIMQGVFFDKDCCVATDTRVLVIYNETKTELVGNTYLSTGEVIKGEFPDYNRVIPKTEGKPVSVDWKCVYNALKWYKKQPNFNPNDKVCIGGCHLAMTQLLNLLEIYKSADELFFIKATTFGPLKSMMLETEQLKSIIMPCTPEEDRIDIDREDFQSIVMSYENFILTFVIESNKPKEVVKEMSWL